MYVISVVRIMEYPGYCQNMRLHGGYDIKRDPLYIPRGQSGVAWYVHIYNYVGEQQDNSLQDYIESSLMLQYTKHWHY